MEKHHHRTQRDTVRRTVNTRNNFGHTIYTLNTVARQVNTLIMFKRLKSSSPKRCTNPHRPQIAAQAAAPEERPDRRHPPQTKATSHGDHCRTNTIDRTTKYQPPRLPAQTPTAATHHPTPRGDDRNPTTPPNQPQQQRPKPAQASTSLDAT